MNRLKMCWSLRSRSPHWLIETLKRGARWDGVETDLIRRDGDSLAAFIRAAPLMSRGNTFIGGLIVITDRRQQKFFQTQSDHLERRAWLGDVSAIFAHDVRNPLNGISTGLGLFATKFLPPDPLAERVGMMQAEVLRIDQLVNNVLLAVKSSEANYQQTSSFHYSRGLSSVGRRVWRNSTSNLKKRSIRLRRK